MVKRWWSKILNNGVHAALDFEQVSRVRISNAISVVGAIFAFIYSIILLLNSQYRLALNDVFFIANLLLLYLFNHWRYYRVGTVLTFITVPLSLLLVNYEYGQIGTEYYFYGAIVLSFYYFKRPLNRYLVSAYFVALILATKYIETIVVLDEFAANIEPYILISNILMSLAILFLSVSLFMGEHIKYQVEIQNKNEQLNHALNDAHEKNDQVNLVLKELNHRVKNNLQMVSSLFNIQSYKTKNKETRRALKDARNRIVSIAIMHQKLYKDNLFHEVKLKKYIEELVEYLIQSVGTDENLKVTVNVEDIKLRIEDTVHVGLLINELITNALKYGYSNQNKRNEVSVELFLSNKLLTIIVCDSGSGFPNDFSIEKTDSFGLDLVHNIVNQHEGRIFLSSNNGARVELQLNITEFSD